MEGTRLETPALDLKYLQNRRVQAFGDSTFRLVDIAGVPADSRLELQIMIDTRCRPLRGFRYVPQLF